MPKIWLSFLPSRDIDKVSISKDLIFNGKVYAGGNVSVSPCVIQLSMRFMVRRKGLDGTSTSFIG